MFLEIPSLGETPTVLRTASASTAHAALGYQMANMGLIEPADLTIGTGGLRRLIEKSWQRMWAEDDLPAEIPRFPLGFTILDNAEGRIPGARSGEPWLMLDCRASRDHKAYLQFKYGKAHEKQPEVAEHALATLYTALDVFSYCVTPPVFLAFASRYWWGGGEDITKEQRKQTGFLTRKMFHTRFPEHVCHPRRSAGLTRGRHPWREVRDVERAMSTAPMLTRNAIELAGVPAWDVPMFVRWRWNNDDWLRLIDHWANEVGDNRVGFTGAWPMRNVVEIEHVRRALPRTVRLINATNHLLMRLAQTSQGGFFF